MHPTPDTLSPIFRSAHKAESDERAFVLTAVGITNVVLFDGMDYVVAVDAALAEAARRHLAQYASESRPAPATPPPPRLNPFAWIGCVAYAVVVIVVGYAVAAGFWRLDAFDVGAIDASRVKGGEWWRAWTALTLHADTAHLISNLGAGAWFGYLAGRQLGPGNAWLLAVTAAGFANLAESLLGPSSHRSVGASTAVFTMLGMLAAHTWRIRYELPQRWALRWGPLIAGAILLGWTGTGGLSGFDPPEVVAASTTDIVAHVAGFASGVVIGSAAAIPRVRRLLARIPQRASGVATLAILAIAWVFALAS